MGTPIAPLDMLIHDDPLTQRAIAAVDAIAPPSAAYRNALLWMVVTPTRDAWERLYHTIPVPSARLSLWEAVRQIQPTFPLYVKLDEDGYACWEVCPTREDFVNALELLTY